MSESPSTSGDEKIVGDREIGGVFLNIQGDGALHIGLVEGDMIKYEFGTDRGAMNFFAVYCARGKNEQACICAPASSEYQPSNAEQLIPGVEYNDQ